MIPALYPHDRYFGYVLQLKQFQSIRKHGGKVKPVATIFPDGGPEKSPSLPKTLDVAIQHFKKHKFDALLISNFVPGMSTYNQVER